MELGCLQASPSSLLPCYIRWADNNEKYVQFVYEAGIKIQSKKMNHSFDLHKSEAKSNIDLGDCRIECCTI